jgi:tyrosine-protein kinase Etk/Wzc
MNRQQVSAEFSGDAEEPGFSFVALLTVLAKYKKSIVRFPLIVGVLTAAISFALPDVYKSSTKLLPPQQSQGGAAALLSQLGGVAGAAAGIAGIKNPNDMYVGMLKSRTVADRLIARFGLMEAYDVKLMEKARKELESNTLITSGKDGLITIEVEDEDRKKVANIANGYVQELYGLSKVLAITEASQRRMFFERQLEMAKDNLANAEVKLKGALDTHGVISVDGQSRALIETVGRVRAQISAKEIQMRSMQAFVTASNPAYQRVQEELNSLRNELDKLENGRQAPAIGTSKDGKDGLENIKVLRDVKYYQMLYELLAKQYELARLDEAKDPSIVQVLDRAVEPERKFKPKRALMVLVSIFLAFFAAVAWAYIREANRRARLIPAEAARWDEMMSHLRK